MEFLKKAPYKAFKPGEILKSLNIPHTESRRVRRILKRMAAEERIVRQKGGKYSYLKRTLIKEGILKVTNRGFGFVEVKGYKDIFISLDDMGNALNGDYVQVRLYPKYFGPNPEGKIIAVKKRGKERIVGTFIRERNRYYILPDYPSVSRPIPVSIKKGLKVEIGKRVVARLVSGESISMWPRGEIVEVIGDPDDPRTDLLAVIIEFNLPDKFSPGVLEEAESISSQLTVEEIERRLDLRAEICFTIDPSTAKDFDDAVSLRLNSSGNYILGVHISDVSYYVAENSKIDREAAKRGTSIYLINDVIPMLPERLSGYICSLQPGEDRLAFSVIAELNPGGKLINFDIKETVIKSNRRFTYSEAQQIIDSGKGDFAELLLQMRKLSRLLKHNREILGSIDFDIPEPILRLDAHGIPYEITPSERFESHNIIEEFMLLANKIVAEYVNKQLESNGYPFIYRVHDKPDEENLDRLLSLLRQFGINCPVSKPVRPGDYRNILNYVENMKERDLIEKVALRSMAKARYSSKNIGHFGLAFPVYTHFTSPIRRYPDLVVHRLLKQYLNFIEKSRIKYYKRKIPAICRKSTDCEIRANEAEREMIKLKQLKFISSKIGNVYEGIISGVTSFGFFVEITDFLIEGLVNMRDLDDDYYVFDKFLYRLTGTRKKRVFSLGDRVTVKIKAVNVSERKLDLILAG